MTEKRGFGRSQRGNPEATQRHLATIQRYFSDVSFGQVEENSDTPALIHGDLGQQHILFVPAAGWIGGVLDWGIAGFGDLAHDYGVLINCYGESFVRRMARYTPEIGALIDRARFMSFLAEPSWVLRGLRSRDPTWFRVSLGTARDIQPIGSEWD